MRKRHFQRIIKEKLKDYPLIVVSNREPYIHNWNEDRIECLRPASGLTVALDPMMQTCGGVWIAHGSGSADRETVDHNQKATVPPENPWQSDPGGTLSFSRRVKGETGKNGQFHCRRWRGRRDSASA